MPFVIFKATETQQMLTDSSIHIPFFFNSTFNSNCYAEKMFVREMHIRIILGSGLSDVKTPLYISGSQHRVQGPLWGPQYDF